MKATTLWPVSKYELVTAHLFVTLFSFSPNDQADVQKTKQNKTKQTNKQKKKKPDEERNVLFYAHM